MNRGTALSAPRVDRSGLPARAPRVDRRPKTGGGACKLQRRAAGVCHRARNTCAEAGTIPNDGHDDQPPPAALGDLDLEAHLADPALKQRFVTPMFDIIAPRYDRFTRVFSFGMDRQWKAELIDWMRSRPSVPSRASSTSRAEREISRSPRPSERCVVRCVGIDASTEDDRARARARNARGAARERSVPASATCPPSMWTRHRSTRSPPGTACGTCRTTRRARSGDRARAQARRRARDARFLSTRITRCGGRCYLAYLSGGRQLGRLAMASRARGVRLYRAVDRPFRLVAAISPRRSSDNGLRVESVRASCLAALPCTSRGACSRRGVATDSTCARVGRSRTRSRRSARARSSPRPFARPSRRAPAHTPPRAAPRRTHR